jgi:hypothetical protein
MSSTNLSRRAMLAGAVSVPALALPAALASGTAAVADAPLPSKSLPAEISPIDRLWEKREVLNREYNRVHRMIKKLKRQLEQQMPVPHPSIVYSPENDADGLKWDTPHMKPFSFIHPYNIVIELSKAKYGVPELVYEYDVERLAKLLEQRPLTEKQIALRDRLAARLELSEQQAKVQHELSGKVGLSKLHKKTEGLLARMGDIESRILSARSLKRSDIEKKLVLYDRNPDWCAPYVVRDLRRVFDGAAVFPVEA